MIDPGMAFLKSYDLFSRVVWVCTGLILWQWVNFSSLIIGSLGKFILNILEF